MSIPSGCLLILLAVIGLLNCSSAQPLENLINIMIQGTICRCFSSQYDTRIVFYDCKAFGTRLTADLVLKGGPFSFKLAGLGLNPWHFYVRTLTVV